MKLFSLILPVLIPLTAGVLCGLIPFSSERRREWFLAFSVLLNSLLILFLLRLYSKTDSAFHKRELAFLAKKIEQ